MFIATESTELHRKFQCISESSVAVYLRINPRTKQQTSNSYHVTPLFDGNGIIATHTHAEDG